MKKIITLWCLLLIVLAGCTKNESQEVDPELPYLRPVTAQSGKWIAEILDYAPAPGQFINDDQSTPEGAQAIVGGKGIVSLGGFGGYIVFRFDHTVLNGQGYDFVIHGNAADGGSEPGIVWVACDLNGNGKPDPEEWFELAGADHALSSTVKNYEITYYKPGRTDVAADIAWTDNGEESGAMHTELVANYHPQSFWPLFGAGATVDRLTFRGTRLLPPFVLNDRGIWVLGAAGKGYADNFSDDYLETINGDPDTRGSNKFDIDNAVDANGNKVHLKGIDFIKVYTATRFEAGWLGETSTEVCGAISLSVKH